MNLADLNTRPASRGWLGAALLVLVGCAFSAGRAQVVYDPAATFSTSANPSGGWSFGYTSTPGQLVLFESSSDWVGGSVARWNRGAGTDISYPIAFYNYSGGAVAYADTLTIPIGQFGLHPGPNGSGAEYAVARFSLPQGGDYTLNATFRGIESYGGGTTTDVHVRVGGVPVFDGTVGGFGQTAVLSGYAFTAAAGTWVDFLVGPGGNNFIGDTTGLQASLSVVPEPASAALLLLGLGGWAAWRRRR